MGDLIWIGNTLLPRGFVITVVALIVVSAVALWTVLTDEGHMER